MQKGKARSQNTEVVGNVIFARMAEAGETALPALVEAVDGSPAAAVASGKNKEKINSKAKAKPKVQATGQVPSGGNSEEQKRILEKRINIFEKLQAEQKKHREEIGGEAIKITLPDGNVKEGKKWITTPLDIAREISKALAENALISEVCSRKVHITSQWGLRRWSTSGATEGPKQGSVNLELSIGNFVEKLSLRLGLIS